MVNRDHHTVVVGRGCVSENDRSKVGKKWRTVVVGRSSGKSRIRALAKERGVGVEKQGKDCRRRKLPRGCANKESGLQS